MITRERYTIINNLTDLSEPVAQLCILNFDIRKEIKFLKDFIKKNSNTTFWAATKNFSKNYVQTASKLGIKNLVQFPVSTEIIENFFNKSEASNSKKVQTEFELLKNSKILIVDDNDFNLILLTEILNDIGVGIKTCNDSVEACRLIKDEHFDLFLLDILMPDLSGFELVEEIKKTTINKNSPIIFISAITGTENIINGYQLGAYSYIEKPFCPSLVKAQIYNILKSEETKEEIDKQKEDFVATLTHDLKSPINAEINALKYMLRNCNNNDNEILSELLNSAQYMKLITDKILSHYKSKNNKITLKKELADLNTVILSCIEDTKYLTTDKNLKIRFYNNSDNEQLLFDVIEIKRVIMNLIANSVEYSKRNNYIDIVLKNNEREYIFSIKDYGIGIDLEKHTEIFDNYITLSKEQKKIGFGLGLSICKQIISAHNGQIFIYSKPTKGTKIVFTIPISK